MAYTQVTRVRVKYGRLAEFFDVMENMVIPAVTRGGGQRLVAAYQTVFGDTFHEVLHIWELDDVNGLLDGVAAGGSSDELEAIFARLQEVIEDEKLSLATGAPYHPQRP
jgi:hypothetical protein